MVFDIVFISTDEKLREKAHLYKTKSEDLFENSITIQKRLAGQIVECTLLPDSLVRVAICVSKVNFQRCFRYHSKKNSFDKTKGGAGTIRVQPHRNHYSSKRYKSYKDNCKPKD